MEIAGSPGPAIELGGLYELHRALLESAKDPVAIFDEKGNLLLMNSLFAAVAPPETEPFTLRQLRARLIPQEGAELFPSGSAWEGEAYWGEELYSLRLVPLPPTQISPDGGTILTMTSLRTREERDRARAEALGFVTHELRTPLTAIQGFAELMLHYPNSPSCAAAPATIARESKRLLALINTYLDLLRVDAGAKPLQTSVIDPNELVKQVFSILEPLAAAVGRSCSAESASSTRAALPATATPTWFCTPSPTPCLAMPAWATSATPTPTPTPAGTAVRGFSSRDARRPEPRGLAGCQPQCDRLRPGAEARSP